MPTFACLAISRGEDEPYATAHTIAKHTKVDMIWVAGRSPTLVSHSLRGVATNLKATTLAYLAITIVCQLNPTQNQVPN
jgi:hypothetical protein